MNVPMLGRQIVVWAAVMGLILGAWARPSAGQACGAWLPGPSSPDLPLNAGVVSMAVIGGELYAYASLYEAAATTQRLFVLRAGF